MVPGQVPRAVKGGSVPNLSYWLGKMSRFSTVYRVATSKCQFTVELNKFRLSRWSPALVDFLIDIGA
jgi:hypothetical protein